MTQGIHQPRPLQVVREVSDVKLDTILGTVNESLSDNYTSVEPSICEEFKIPEYSQMSPEEICQNPFVVLDTEDKEETKEVVLEQEKEESKNEPKEESKEEVRKETNEVSYDSGYEICNSFSSPLDSKKYSLSPSQPNKKPLAQKYFQMNPKNYQGRSSQKDYGLSSSLQVPLPSLTCIDARPTS